MRTRHKIAGLLTVLGIMLAVGAVGIVIWAIPSAPVMLKPPEEAACRAEALMNGVCSGDDQAVSDLLYGNPGLGSPPEDSGPAVDLLWEAFRESLEYTFLGDCYVSDSGVAIDVRVRSLDVPGVLEGLDSRAQALLNRRILAAENSKEIYDEENNFRQDLVTEILQEAVRQSLEENRKMQEQTFSIHLIFDQGEWWVVPDAGLVNVLSGSFSG